MSESQTISIRLDASELQRLDAIAATENTTRGVLLKRQLLVLLESYAAGEQPPHAMFDPQRLAAEIVQALREKLPAENPELKQIGAVLRELVHAFTRIEERTTAEFDHIRQDLKTLCGLLEDGVEALPPASHEPPHPPEGRAGFLKFDE